MFIVIDLDSLQVCVKDDGDSRTWRTEEFATLWADENLNNFKVVEV